MRRAALGPALLLGAVFGISLGACGVAGAPVATTPVPRSPVVSASPVVAPPSPAELSGFGSGDCTAPPRGVKSAPAADSFKVVIQVPDGWLQVPIGPTESVIFALTATGASSQATRTITGLSHLGKFGGRTTAQLAADSFSDDPKRVIVGLVTDCTVAGGPASYFRYTRASGSAGVQVFFLHQDLLYSLRVETAGQLDPGAERDAKAVLGSWSWTDPPPASGRRVELLSKLSCRLPARLEPAGSAGFLDLSTGLFVEDGSAPKGGSYSWAAQRWLPVPYNQVAPDGLHYAQVEDGGSGTNRIHVVDVAAGTDRVLLKDGPWYVSDYAREGVYIEKRNTAANYGLWLLEPVTGAVSQILPERVVGLTLGGGAGWVEDVVSEGPAARAVYRVDLQTGARTLWFMRSSPFAVYYASDGVGDAIVSWESVTPNDHATELWLLSKPQDGVLLYSGSHEGEPFPSGVADGNGSWLTGNSSNGSLWLLTPDHRLTRIAASPVVPLGGCR